MADKLAGSWHWVLAVVFAPVAYWFADVLGGWTPQMKFLCVAIGADFALGVLCSIRQRRVSSSICLNGILKKAAYFLVVLLMEQAGQALGQAHTLRDMAVLGFTMAEGLSVLENAVALDVWIPEAWRDQLRGVLAQLNGKKTG